MTKTKLAKGISLVLSTGILGIAITENALASATYYNTNKPIETTITDSDRYTDWSDLGTDGWTRSNDQANTGTVLPWLGTSGGSRPFGYVGLSALNWAAHVTNAGDSLEISQSDAATHYGTGWGSAPSSLVNIDTAKGAWNDGAQGWAHNTDIGLFKSDVTARVTLNLTSLFLAADPGPQWSTFGITVFTGMDTDDQLTNAITPNTDYSHHAEWNSPLVPFTSSNPMYTTGVVYDGSIGISIPGQAYSGNVDDVNGFTFLAQAGQVYSIYLGGNSGPGNFDPHAGYQLNITTAPVPGAVWLFGSALFGLIGFSRRQKNI